MPLLHNPLDNLGLPANWLCLSNHGDYDHDKVQRGNAAAYLAGMFALAHGRRDAVPAAMLWCKASCLAHLTNEHQDSMAAWAKMFLDYMEEWLLTLQKDQLVLEAGDSTANVLDIISRGKARLDKLEVSESSDMLPELLKLSGDEGKLMDFIGKCSGTGAVVASNCQAWAEAQLKNDGNDYSVYLLNARAFIQASFGNNFMHIPRMVGDIFRKLGKAYDFAHVWKVAANHLCATRALAGSYDSEPRGGEDESSTSRRYRRQNHRCTQAVTDEEVFDIRSRLAGLSVDEAMDRVVELVHKYGVGNDMDRLYRSLGYVGAYVEAEAANFVPITFMPSHAFDQFEKEGRTRNFWDLADRPDFKSSWHHRYSDVPEHGRLINDLRLFGEKGRWLTHGVITHRGMTDQIKTLADMYGSIAVTWEDDVLDFCTITMNDSQVAPYILPCNKRSTMRNLLFAFMAPRLLNLGQQHPLTRIIGEAVFDVAEQVNFVEFQAHDFLTADDVRDVMDLS